MRILLDQAVHDHRNKGNNALLEAALTRLKDFWPEASFSVISIAPHFCKIYFPGTHPVDPNNLQEYKSILDVFHRFVPRPVWRFLFELRERLFSRIGFAITSGNIRSTLSIWLGRDHQDRNHDSTFDHDKDIATEPIEQERASAELNPRIAKFDLYVATGGGYMCDSDKEFLLQVFDRIEAAVAQGVTAVMVGQGVGPMEDTELLLRARKILPSADLILYRNQRLGFPLLNSLGVNPDRIIMTGDDAIKMAFDARPGSLGSGIGVSVRVASYTQVAQRQLDILRMVVRRAATEREVALVAVPISFALHESDMTYIHHILDGYSHSYYSRRTLDTHHDAIRFAGMCRMTVSGTYHGAIFSLAQGIPVVGIAGSIEYYNKLSELSEEFGPGCQVILLADENFGDRLSKAIDHAWSMAEELRPLLLDSAVRLIKSQRAAYNQIFELLQS
jgi:colanic acid/amylovoran biosynthesis protein